MCSGWFLLAAPAIGFPVRKSVENKSRGKKNFCRAGFSLEKQRRISIYYSEANLSLSLSLVIAKVQRAATKHQISYAPRSCCYTQFDSFQQCVCLQISLYLTNFLDNISSILPYACSNNDLDLNPGVSSLKLSCPDLRHYFFSFSSMELQVVQNRFLLNHFPQFLEPCANGRFRLTVCCPLSIVLSACHMLDTSEFALLPSSYDLWSLAIKVLTYYLKFIIHYDPSFRHDATEVVFRCSTNGR